MKLDHVIENLKSMLSVFSESIGKRYVIRWAKTNDFIKDKYLEKGSTKDPRRAAIFTKLPDSIGNSETGFDDYELDPKYKKYLDIGDSVVLSAANYDFELERYKKVLAKKGRH